MTPHSATTSLPEILIQAIATGAEVRRPLATVSVITEAKAGKTKIEFEKQGDVLVSKSKLPEGDGYNMVVQLKSNADAKRKTIDSNSI